MMALTFYPYNIRFVRLTSSFLSVSFTNKKIDKSHYITDINDSVLWYNLVEHIYCFLRNHRFDQPIRSRYKRGVFMRKTIIVLSILLLYIFSKTW